MGNQYSVTVSDESDQILRRLKEDGKMPSRAVDVAVRALGIVGLARLMRLMKHFEETWEYDG
jgi:hypothetical protein